VEASASKVPAATNAAPGHNAYMSVRGASSMKSGTDGRPNCSVRSGDGTVVVVALPTLPARSGPQVPVVLAVLQLGG